MGEQVEYPERMEPRVKSRFEMLIAPKEHEMHHRGQLMVVERMLGITPHLRRQMEERIASMRPAQTGPIDTGNCAVDTIAANRILDARSRAKPRGTMPSSTAAAVACRAFF